MQATHFAGVCFFDDGCDRLNPKPSKPPRQRTECNTTKSSGFAYKECTLENSLHFISMKRGVTPSVAFTCWRGVQGCTLIWSNDGVGSFRGLCPSYGEWAPPSPQNAREGGGAQPHHKPRRAKPPSTTLGVAPQVFVYVRSHPSGTSWPSRHLILQNTIVSRWCVKAESLLWNGFSNLDGHNSPIAHLHISPATFSYLFGEARGASF